MDELDPSAREMLRRAREARTPTAEDRDRLERRIAATLAMAGAVAATSAATASATVGATSTGAAVVKTGGAALWAKGLVVALVVGAAATGAVIAVQRPANPETPVARAAITAPDATRAAMPTVHAPVEIEDVVIAAPEDEAVEAPDEPRVRRRAPSPPPSAGDLAAELELLHAAQHAWRAGDGARTLQLVSEHEDRFARSQLAPERTTLRILALCNVGRVDEARRAASRFLRTARQSPLRRSVEESCAAQ